MQRRKWKSYLEVENEKKEFQFQTSIRFNNQHTGANSPTNSFKQRKEDEHLC